MRLVATFTTLFLLAGASYGQVGGTGTIQGTVTDPSGASVSGASVTATNLATGVKTERKTTDAGFYVLSLLPAGEYTVTVSANGFQNFIQDHVILDALQVVGVNPKLQLGQATQSVTVEAAPSVLKTDDVALGSTMQNNVYDALPLAMNAAGSPRDPSAFAGLAVGVDNYSTQAAGPSTGAFNGGQTYQNEVYIEGLPLTSAGTEADTRNLAFGVSVEAVDQFQVETAGAKAMYEGQGVENYVLKSGGNQFHGGVFEYFRNTDFDARGFFAAVLPVDHQNEFGASISGPIRKNKLFFFGNYDGYRLVSATTPVGYQSIPTTAERTGDFSAFPQIIYDPTSATGTAARTPFPGNVIPSNRISKVSQSLQSYLPPPTNGNITNNYLAVLPSKVNNDSTTDKVDYNLSDRNRLFALFSTGKYNWPTVGSLTPVTTSTLPTPYTDGRSVIEYSTVGQIHDSYTVTPSIVNQFSASLSRLWIPLTDPTATGNYPGKAGLTGLPAGFASTAFPDISFTGQNPPVSWDGTNSHVFNEAQNTFDVQDNLLWIKGKHNLTFGFQWQSLQDNESFALNAAFTFSNNETAQFVNGALSPTTGLGYAGYLLGMVDGSSNTQDSVAETGGRYKTYAFYVQDDFKVSSRLTLNLGLRWNIWSPFTEVANRMSFFNPALANPVAGGIPGALQFAGTGTDSCHCATPVQQHNVNPGPRIGAAYRLGDKTVIRAGYSIFYAHAGGVGGRTNGRQGLSQVGFNGTNAQSSIATGQPAYIWDNGVPSIAYAPPYINPSYGIGFITAASALAAGAPWAGPSTAIGMTYGDPAFGGKAPYYEDWSFNIQHSITQNLLFSVAYSASAGHWLPGAGVAGLFTNQIPVKYLPLQGTLSSTLNATSLAQVQALFPSFNTPFPNFTGTVAQALKPFPQYGGISDPWLDVGNSTYNSLQISLTQRLSRGLTFMFNYTYSKELDDLAGVRDPNKDFLEKGPGAIDHPTVVAATFVYQLPIGKGHKLTSSSPAVNAIIGNWQFSGIFTYSGGAPLSITGSCTGGGIIDAVCYPNYAANFSGSVWQNGTPGNANITTTAYLNKAAFADAPAYTEGVLARSAPLGLFAPHIADMDISVRKEVAIRERVRLALQADAFNVNNAVHFAAPGTNIDSATFGIFTAMSNSPRKLQFSARISF
ncbi:MAG TPA: TonB-dependent receptor [Verrucomicrobiae bacterium]|nr:TonB-dependent receptor [Verrucomicrobiae bacterium]